MIVSSRALFTGLEDRPRPGAAAVAGNRIVAVGDEREMESLIGPHTVVRRYGDELLMPGFHDFHIHLTMGALYEETVNLSIASSEEEAAAMTQQFANTRPEDPWVIGFSWYHIYWKKKEPPHRRTLDRLIPDRPVFLVNAECHGAWVNSKALERLGITRDTPDPPYGHIVKDENGEPTGLLMETAMGLATEALEFSQARRAGLLETFLRKAARLGVTSVHDMFPLPGFEIGDLGMYRAFEETGRLTTRIHFLAALEDDLDRARRLRDAYRSERLRFAGLKLFLDGVPTTRTAYLLAPYADAPETRGDTLLPPDVIRRRIDAADREGFRIRLHACGDGAVRLGLDALGAAREANGARDARHTIEHIEVIDPADLGRFAELGVIASMQPEHLAASERFADNDYLARLGPERSRLTWPIRSLRERGARLAFGSDFPVVELDPFRELYRAVTRTFNDGCPAGGWNPQERIGLADAVRAYTAGSAYGAFRERELGTLEPGKLADFVVLDRNPFEEPPDRLLDARVKLTVMDGETIYEEG
ncbi:amidohydrolase [Paenibacillus sp. TRM 82003]|nr:amidohydrolase [Paenibacillus sp. TRM 82003]